MGRRPLIQRQRLGQIVGAEPRDGAPLFRLRAELIESFPTQLMPRYERIDVH
jgi:hypothetical protein